MHFIYLLLICFSLSLFAQERPPHIDAESWEQVAPFLLPATHPLKPQLDALFTNSSKRVISSLSHLKERGFFFSGEPHTTHILVLGHKNLKNWLIKAFTEEEEVDEVMNYTQRCKGAIATRKAIHLRKQHLLFAVPQKYIYVLEPVGTPGPFRKNFILVVENMPIYTHAKNRKIWKKAGHNPKVLTAFFTILTDVGLVDCGLIDNASWGRNGKINFIDTEHYHLWPVDYAKLNKYLDPKGRNYWHKLIESQK